MAGRRDPAPRGKVGYGAPPVETRFKPGQSGNPAGRPPKPRGAKPILAAELNELITVTVGGRRRRVTLLQTILKRLVAESAKGDLKAAALLRQYILLIGYDGVLGDLESMLLAAAQDSGDTEMQQKFRPWVDAMLITRAMVAIGFCRQNREGRYFVSRTVLDRILPHLALQPAARERVLARLGEHFVD